jgi:hypothetical protein
MVLMEKRVRNKEYPLSFDELPNQLSLSYEILSLVEEITNYIDLTEEKDLFTTQFKSKCRNWERIAHKVIDYKARCEQPQKL